MSSRVIEVTRHEMEARRDEIVRRVGRTLPALEEGVKYNALNGDEWEALEELQGIHFLLEHDDA